jgi:hypothetical protein
VTRVTITVGDVVAVARLLDDEAPRAVRRLLSALPIEGRLRQSRWSGETTYASFAELVDLSLQASGDQPPLESPASIMCSGTLHYGPAKGNLGFAYGQAQSRAVGGANTWGIHVATVEEELGRYLAALRGVRRGGAMDFAIAAHP